MTKFPGKVMVRLTQEDFERLNQASIRAEIPNGTLARIMLRQALTIAEVAGEGKLLKNTNLQLN